MTFDGDVDVDPTVVVGLDAPDSPAASRAASPNVSKVCGLVDLGRYDESIELLQRVVRNANEALPLNVIVDHNGEAHVHVAVNDNDKVNE